MIEVAREEGIPIMRNVPLARSCLNRARNSHTFPRSSSGLWPRCCAGAIAQPLREPCAPWIRPRSPRFWKTLIHLCDDLAWNRPADADMLFRLTAQGASTPDLERLAEAFGMMVVKVEARDFHRSELTAQLEQVTKELEEARACLHERNMRIVDTLQREFNVRRIIGRCRP